MDKKIKPHRCLLNQTPGPRFQYCSLEATLKFGDARATTIQQGFDFIVPTVVPSEFRLLQKWELLLISRVLWQAVKHDKRIKMFVISSCSDRKGLVYLPAPSSSWRHHPMARSASLWFCQQQTAEQIVSRIQHLRCWSLAGICFYDGWGPCA